MGATILAVSDIVLDSIYSLQIADRFPQVEMVVGCGDLPYYYLEYIISTLNIPLYFVRGNHDPLVEHAESGDHSAPLGAIDLHRRVLRDKSSGLLLAGVEGSLRYTKGSFQYTQAQMWSMVLGLLPRLYLNRLRFGRYLDLFITHAPPFGVHDQPDPPHQGIRAFTWFDRVFQPRLHLHGHIHIHTNLAIDQRETLLGKTRVLNVYGYQEFTLK